MFAGSPSSSEVLANSRTTSGTLITVPAGKWYTGNLTVGVTASGAGTFSPTVAISGTGGGPSDATVIGRATATGVALLGPVADNSDTEIIIKAEGNDIALVFTAAGAASYATVNGFIYG